MDVPSVASDKGDTEFTVLDGGAYLGYEEMVYAQATGATSRDNLLQYLTDGEPLETVCAAAAAGEETLASLFATASTKQIVDIETLDDITADQFEERETGRPPGYCAQTILRFGGLDVMALLDGGATCSALPEEVVLAIIGYALKQIDTGKYTAKSREYPIVRLQRLVKRPRIDGVAAGAPIEITYTVVLRTRVCPGRSGLRAHEGLVLQSLPEGYVPSSRSDYRLPRFGRRPLRPWPGDSSYGSYLFCAPCLAAAVGARKEKSVFRSQEAALRPRAARRWARLSTPLPGNLSADIAQARCCH